MLRDKKYKTFRFYELKLPGEYRSYGVLFQGTSLYIDLHGPLLKERVYVSGPELSSFFKKHRRTNLIPKPWTFISWVDTETPLPVLLLQDLCPNGLFYTLLTI